MPVAVEDARKAVQMIQYSIRGIAELLVAGQKIENQLIEDAASGFLSAASVLDLYLTGEVSARRSRQDIDAQGALLFLSLMTPFRFKLSSPGMVLTFSWPRDGAEIFQLEGDDEHAHARWRDLFLDRGEDGTTGGSDRTSVSEPEP